MTDRTLTYKHTVSGLLQKRAEMMEEIAEARERLAELSNDVEAIDRVLERLGYSGELQLTPRPPRVVLFYRDELRQFILDQLRNDGPLSARQLSERLVQSEGKDPRDRRMLRNLVNRVCKALRQMQSARIVTRADARVNGEYLWRTQP
jgi:hypothetical protein